MKELHDNSCDVKVLYKIYIEEILFSIIIISTCIANCIVKPHQSYMSY